MENATKALLIAGGILIAIIILTIGLYLYAMYSNQAKQYNQVISDTELQKFNSKFEIYTDRDNITVHDIITVVDLAKEYEDTVKIYLNNSHSHIIFTISATQDEYKSQENFIKKYLNNTFECEEVQYNNIGKIASIYFKTNE